MDQEVFHQTIAVGVTLSIFVILQVRRRTSLDFLFLSGLMIVTLAGVITPQEAFSGFSERAVLTLAALLAIAAALRSCGVLDWVGQMLLGRVTTASGGRTRLALTLVAGSAFVLNTALVAMFAPVVVDWCRKRGISPSRMLIPVSYFAILGGVCTLIGTSTTLVVNARIHSKQEELTREIQEIEATLKQAPGEQEKTELEGQLKQRRQLKHHVQSLGLFEIGAAGLPCAIVGTLYLLIYGYRLLPDRVDMIEQLGDERRDYLIEMMVQSDCKLIGKTVEEAGLRQLPGLFLIEIDRDGDFITPVSPTDSIHENDRLVFTGVVETIVDLEKIQGLIPAADLSYEFHPKSRVRRHLTEAVVSSSSPLIGTTVKKANFRKRYNAAVIAVHRNGHRLERKIGDIVLETGDTLLLQTRSEFVSANRNNRDFYLVSDVQGSQPRRHDRTKLAGAIFVGLIVWLIVASFPAFRDVSLAAPEVAAFTGVVLLVLTSCLRVSEARNSIDLQLLVTIAAALGLGTALDRSGAASLIAVTIIEAVGNHPYVLLIVIYLLSMLMTELITNNAVAALMFPLAFNLAAEAGYNPRPFIIAIALAASLSFITPIGYQTNLMVMGPGGYRSSDFFKCGVPLSILVAITSIIVIPWVWTFTL